ncbi:hypothetical protein [Sporolactobacillus sp. THM19-2]|nr:hypothetical protein [Sporolactobacillus sp. THM19-2]
MGKLLLYLQVHQLSEQGFKVAISLVNRDVLIEEFKCGLFHEG